MHIQPDSSPRHEAAAGTASSELQARHSSSGRVYDPRKRPCRRVMGGDVRGGMMKFGELLGEEGGCQRSQLEDPWLGSFGSEFGVREGGSVDGRFRVYASGLEFRELRVCLVFDMDLGGCQSSCKLSRNEHSLLHSSLIHTRPVPPTRDLPDASLVPHVHHAHHVRHVPAIPAGLPKPWEPRVSTMIEPSPNRPRLDLGSSVCREKT